MALVQSFRWLQCNVPFHLGCYSISICINNTTFFSLQFKSRSSTSKNGSKTRVLLTKVAETALNKMEKRKKDLYLSSICNFMGYIFNTGNPAATSNGPQDYIFSSILTETTTQQTILAPTSTFLSIGMLSTSTVSTQGMPEAC